MHQHCASYRMCFSFRSHTHTHTHTIKTKVVLVHRHWVVNKLAQVGRWTIFLVLTLEAPGPQWFWLHHYDILIELLSLFASSLSSLGDPWEWARVPLNRRTVAAIPQCSPTTTNLCRCHTRYWHWPYIASFFSASTKPPHWQQTHLTMCEVWKSA